MEAFVNPAARRPPSPGGTSGLAAQRSPASIVMTREQYANAYDSGYATTKRFLVSRGINVETAEEAAQAAWARGWEHRDKLRNPDKVLSWVNTIALNLFRNWFRRPGNRRAVGGNPDSTTRQSTERLTSAGPWRSACRPTAKCSRNTTWRATRVRNSDGRGAARLSQCGYACCGFGAVFGRRSRRERVRRKAGAW